MDVRLDDVEEVTLQKKVVEGSDGIKFVVITIYTDDGKVTIWSKRNEMIRIIEDLDP